MRQSWPVKGLSFCLALLFVLTCITCSLCAQESARLRPVPSLSGEEAGDGIVTIHKRVDQVNLLFTVVDKKGRFVSQLSLSDFLLTDNKLPPERIEFFQQQSELPLRIGLLIDISGSVTSRFRFEQRAASTFFKKVLRPNVDQAFVVGFNENVLLEQDLTNNVGALRKAVSRLRPQGQTALYDAVVFAAEKLKKNFERGTRPVIIVISDGENNSSRTIMRDAQDGAVNVGAPVYAISTNNLERDGYTTGEAVLELLTRYTGGQIIGARDESEFTRAFQRVEEALRSQYVLAYKPAQFFTDGSFRVVGLTTKQAKLKVECRHGYYAPRE